MQLPDLVMVPIEKITPYDNNPRRIPDEAIDAVVQSIMLYGYQQPIVVDKDHVIVVGHTRYEAVKRLGWSEVPVYISNLSAEKAKEYRLVDNRTGEMTSWQHDALVMELREWESDLLESFFPDVDLEIGLINSVLDVTREQMDDATKKVLAVREPDPLLNTKVVCPACFHTFEVQTKSLPGLSQSDLTEMASTSDGRTV